MISVPARISATANNPVPAPSIVDGSGCTILEAIPAIVKVPPANPLERTLHASTAHAQPPQDRGFAPPPRISPACNNKDPRCTHRIRWVAHARVDHSYWINLKQMQIQIGVEDSQSVLQ
mmetsp:Transcript_18947/g.30971  ORF Transcript_18947/g.30971 Transcript_18947/m.30971 type:complete len:119 (-) Transcript_18947:48-404(-)